MKKRILSILLVLVMVIGMIPFSALSASAADTEDLRLFGGKETSKVETTDYGTWYEDDNGHIVLKELDDTTLYWIDRVNLTSAYQNPNTWSEPKLTADFPTGSQPPSLSYYYTNNFVSNLEFVFFKGSDFYRTKSDGAYQCLFPSSYYETSGIIGVQTSDSYRAKIYQSVRLYDTGNQIYYVPDDSAYPVGSYVVEYQLKGGAMPNITFDSGERMKVTLDGAILGESDVQYIPNTYYLVEKDWDSVSSWYHFDSAYRYNAYESEEYQQNAKENSSPNTLYHWLYAYGEKFYVYDEKPEIKSVLVNGTSVADGGSFTANSGSVAIKTTYDSTLSQALQDYGCSVKQLSAYYLNGEKINVAALIPVSNGDGTSTKTYNRTLNSGDVLEIRNWLEVKWPDGTTDIVDEHTVTVTGPVEVEKVNVSANFSGTPANATSNTDGITVTGTQWYRQNGNTWTALTSSDTIKEGGTYRCEVTVVATDGYTLADGYTVKINGTAATKKSGNTWYRDVTITGISDYVEVNDIDLPEAYTNPDFTYDTSDVAPSRKHWDVAKVEWFECDKDGHKLSGALTENDVFKKDTYYRIEVTVVTETNWQFHDTDLNFYINDKAAMPLYGYNKAYPDSVTGYVVYNTADIEGDYELFVYDDSLSGSAKNIYIKDGQYLGSDATAPSDTEPSGGYAYYKDGVLELNGYDNEKAHFIFEELALELYLVGDNTIGAIYDNEWGMAGGNLETRQGNLVIDAADGGKLTIASNPLDAYANIQVKDLYFNGGELTSCLANGTYGAAVQLNDGNLYLENGYEAYVSDTNDFASATKWDGATDISDYDCVWIVTEEEDTGTLKGDFNGDGTVNSKDAAILKRYVSGGWNIEFDEKFDLDGNGSANARDVSLIGRYLSGGWSVEL